MDIKSVYDIAGRAMAAQLVRLNTVASNLANAGSTTGDPKTTYKPLKAIFETQYSDLVKKKWGFNCRCCRGQRNRKRTYKTVYATASCSR